MTDNPFDMKMKAKKFLLNLARLAAIFAARQANTPAVSSADQSVNDSSVSPSKKM